MANAMLDVISDRTLRGSLVTRGYEYAEHNSWDQKKKEYLDLIDSLATERFDDVQGVSGLAVAAETDNGNQPSADPFTEEISEPVVKLDNPSSVSSVKGR